jgi:phytoene dehydrogenase-like protein
MEVDAVLIGTSPLMLIRAAMLARKGDRVVLLERASLPGGSWRTIEVLGFQNVEVGVHLLENRPNLYGFLAEELQVELRSVPSKENFGIFFGRRIGFALTRVLLHSLVTVKAFGTGRWDKAARIFTSARRGVTYFGTPFCYPSQGCSRMISALISRIESAGGKIFLNTSLKEFLLTP